MDQYALTDAEEKSLVGLLYNHVTLGTTLEVFGEETADGVKRIDTLRSVLKKLLQKYELADKLSPEAFLLMGLADMCPREALEAWSKDEDNKHLQLRAAFFLKKLGA
jgi:hypothetical protein